MGNASSSDYNWSRRTLMFCGTHAWSSVHARPLMSGGFPPRQPCLDLLRHVQVRYLASRRGGQCLYDVLGVERSASQADIKRAYLREAKQCHPDVNSSADATRRFQELAHAYQVLGDPSRRAQYDLVGSAAEDVGASGPQSSGSGARRSSSAGPQQPPPPGFDSDVDPLNLFRAVLEEMGSEQVVEYFQQIQQEASQAAQSAQAGDLQPAKAFAWRHKGLAASVMLPMVILLRFPALVSVAMRLFVAAAAVVLQSPTVREALGRYAWYQWRLLMHRAHARAREKKS